MPHHVANKNPRRGVGQFENVEEVAADRGRWIEEVGKMQRALAGRRGVGKGRITPGHQRILKFAGHAEVLLQLLVATPQFLGVPGELRFSVFTLRDIAGKAKRAHDVSRRIPQRHLRG